MAELNGTDLKKALEMAGTDVAREEHPIFERCKSMTTLATTMADCLRAGASVAEYLGTDVDVAAALREERAKIKKAEERITNYDEMVEQNKKLRANNAKYREVNAELKERYAKLKAERDALKDAVAIGVKPVIVYAESGVTTRMQRLELTQKQLNALRKLGVK